MISGRGFDDKKGELRAEDALSEPISEGGNSEKSWLIIGRVGNKKGIIDGDA